MMKRWLGLFILLGFLAGCHPSGRADTPAQPTRPGPTPQSTIALPTTEATGTTDALPTATVDSRPSITVLPNDSGVVNLRSGAGTSFPVLAQVGPGLIARVTGKSPNGEWWQVDYNGRPAWVFTPLVVFTGDPASVPVVP